MSPLPPVWTTDRVLIPFSNGMLNNVGGFGPGITCPLSVNVADTTLEFPAQYCAVISREASLDHAVDGTSEESSHPGATVSTRTSNS